MHLLRTTIVAVGWGWLASRALAQTPDPGSASSTSTDTSSIQNAIDRFLQNPANNAALFDFNYGEPGSPVLPLVGVQSDQITRVEDVRKFGLSLLTGLESDE